MFSFSQFANGQYIVIHKLTSSTHLEVNNEFLIQGYTGVLEHQFTWDDKNEIVDELEAILMTVSPNPTANNIVIRSALKTDLKITIYNEIGAIVFTSDNVKIDQYVDISMLNSGLFIIHIETNDGTFSKIQKLIKI